MKGISKNCFGWLKRNTRRKQIQTEKADSVGRNRKDSLGSRVYAAIFWPAGYYRSFLHVFVAAFAFEARNFSALTQYGMPFVTSAFGVFLVNVP